MGCIILILFTKPENKKAVRLYKKLGYKHSKKDYVMVKRKLK